MYIIDRIEENKVILENISTKEMIEVMVHTLPLEIKEGSVLTYQNGQYELNLTEEEMRRKRIQEKFNKRKNN